MNTRILILALAVAGLGAASSSLAADAAAKPAPAPAPAVVSADEADNASAPLSPILVELQGLFDRIKAKVGTEGEKIVPAQLTAELAEFEAIIAKHPEATADDKASVLWMKTMLYLQVFEDFDQGTAVIRKLKADYPTSKFGVKADEVLVAIAKDKAAQEFQKTLVPGAMLPNFEGKTLDGRPIAVLGFRGKYLLVDFWATWCGPCVAELPNVLAAYEKYNAKGFEVLAVSLDRDEAELRKFVDEKKIPWAQVYEGAEAIAEKFAIESIPTTFLIDREGKIVARDLRGAALTKKLDELLGAK